MPYPYKNTGNKTYNYRAGYNKGDYRVRSPVKSFRDLEVYQKTIQLYAEIIALKFLQEQEEGINREKLMEIAEAIPKLIAEAYGDRFDSAELAHKKITEAITFAADIITKIDLLREKFTENKEIKESLDKLLTKYQTQKRKILNLRKAWDRIFNNDRNGSGKTEWREQRRE